MVSSDSLRRIYYFIFSVGLLALTSYLMYTKILSFNQSYMLFFGALGGFFVADFLTNPKTTVFREHRIFILLPLVLGMALLTSVLITYARDSSLSVVILITVDLLIAGIFGIIDWINKRKQKQVPSQNDPSTT